MMKGKRHGYLSAVKIVAFLLVFLLLFQGATDLFRTKRFLFSVGPIYELPRDSVDVLLLGSSHMNTTISPMDLWNSYGITCFNAAVGDQTIPASYFELRELLKIQKPKVVVLETFYIDHSEMMTVGGEERLHWLVDNIPMSPGVSEAIQTLIQKDHSKLEYYLNFYSFHNRWQELSKADFMADPGYNRGADMSIYHKWSAIEPPKVVPRSERLEPPGLALEYLYKIIKLCQDNQISLVFMAAPCRIDDNRQKMLNYVDTIAQKEQIPYLNFFYLLEEIGFDFATDMVEWSHINYSGVKKLTAYLGEYLQVHCGLADHRSSPDIASRWNADYRAFSNALSRTMIQGAKNVEEYFSWLEGQDYLLIWNACSETPLSGTALPELLRLAGLPEGQVNGENRYCAVTRAGKALYKQTPANKPDGSYMAEDTLFSFGAGINGSTNPIGIHIGRTECSVGNSGLNLAVYDPESRSIVSRAHIDLGEKALTIK